MHCTLAVFTQELSLLVLNSVPIHQWMRVEVTIRVGGGGVHTGGKSGLKPRLNGATLRKQRLLSH